MRYLRSSAWVGGCPALDALAQYDLPIENFRRSIERNVRYAIPATIPLNSPRAFKIRGTPRRS
jgi:hypothetical protein